MADFFQWLSSNSIATNTLVISFGSLIISVILIFVIAFFQGREVTFWPPKVGTKPNGSKKNSPKKIQDKNDGDTNQELAARIAAFEREIKDMRARLAFEEQVIIGLPGDMEKKVANLFLTRDSAVSENNRRKFLETQLNEQEIPNNSSRGYIATQKLTTSILRITPVKSNEQVNIDYVALVREDYMKNNKHTHSAYLAYEITATEQGLKIVAWKDVFE